MDFNLDRSIEILTRTPFVIETLFSGLSRGWLMNNEGENTWSPYEVLGHLIHGEKTDWMIRTAIILSDSEEKTFQPFDRFAQIEAGHEKTIETLIEEFKNLRTENLKKLKALKISVNDLTLEGIHPDLGRVSLKELLATWTAHDLGHIAQITRVMAKQYKNEVGPWKAYLGVLNKG